MSAPAGKSESGSRQSNGTYPALAASGAEEPDAESRPADLPTVEERVSGIAERYADRVFEPVAEQHGRKVREEVLAEAVTVDREVPTGEMSERVDRAVVEQGALPLIAAVAEMLEWYEGYRDKHLRMARGSEVRGDYESFLVNMDNSLTPAYQSKQYARLKALKRQFMGGEYPTGEACEGEFSDPVTVLFGLTASSLRSDGSHRPMADHDREIREAWSGSSSSVKRTLRYVLEEKLGLSAGEYAWWWQSEPHPGPEKDATGYSHSHPVVILDAAAVTGPADPGDAETYRPVVAKHVAECESAGWSAHELDRAVTVREDSEIEDFAGYVSEYLAVSPDQDLLERSDEYLMWAASQWSTTTQKYSRSRWATAACKADACQQQYLDPETEQVSEHGEEVVRSAKPGVRFECSECGSPHGIDQSEGSLARMRLKQSPSVEAGPGGVEAVTDGGEPCDGESGRTLAERWPSARSAASLGSETRAKRCGHEEPDTCPLCATETEAPDHTVSGEVPIPESAEAPSAERVRESFDRPPEWSPDAVVQVASGEETEIGSPGGTAYGEIVVEGAGSITAKTALPYLPRPEALEGPEPWEGTGLFTEADVRRGRVPPPELVAREWVETVQSDRRVTPKEWPSDWYAARFEREEEPEPEPELEPEPESVEECERQLPSEVSRSIVELVETEGVESVPSVMGRLRVAPSWREEVAAVVESVA